MSVTQSSRGSASGYEVGARLHVRHHAGLPPLSADPGIVSIAVAFFLSWLGSVTDRQPSEPARFARIQVRALTGVGAEWGGRS